MTKRGLILGALAVLVVLALVGAGLSAASVSSTASVVLGQPSFVVSNPMTGPEQLRTPAGVVFDSLGNLYVSDFNNNRVLRFDSNNGSFPDTRADLVFGQASMYTNYLGTGDTQMAQPVGLAIDDSGNLYVTDSMNSHVLRFNADSDGIVSDTTADFMIGDLTEAGLSDTMIYLPTDLALDDSGNLYVSNYGLHRVLRFNAGDTGIVNDAVADFVIGQDTFTTDYSGVGDTQLSQPWGIVFDQSRALFISDLGNDRILRFEADTTASGIITDTHADQVFGQPTFHTNTSGVGSQKLNSPSGIDVNGNGDLWVAEIGNHRLLGFAAEADGSVTDTTADYVIGQSDFDTNVANAIGSGSSALSDGGFSGPFGLAFYQGNGMMAVADRGNARVLIFSSTAASQKEDDNNCFIISAAYGEKSPQVQHLRLFRDENLLASRLGRASVNLYYQQGPRTAWILKAHPQSQRLAAFLLLPVTGLAFLLNKLGWVITLAFLLLLSAGPGLLYARIRRESYR